MTGQVRVRPADGNDLDEVVEVGRTAWVAAHGALFEPELAELLLAKWWTTAAVIPMIRSGRTFVAEVGGEIIGTATYGSDEGRRVIWRLYVSPARRGLGAGGALLDSILGRLSELVGLGAPDEHPDHAGRAERDGVAYLPFYDGTPGAAEFVARHGFVEDHRESETSMPDVVWMRRHLTLEGTP